MPPDPPPDPWLARLQRALASSRDGFWERDLRTGECWYSDSLRSLFGFAPDELPNDRDWIGGRIHPDDRPAFVASCEQAIAELASFDYELRVRDRDERWRSVRGRGRVWAGDDGRAAIVAGTVSDVTDERQTLAALARMTERFDDAVNAADEGIFERLADEESMYLSDRLWRLLGYEPGELPSRRATLEGLIHAEDRARHIAPVKCDGSSPRRFDAVLRLRCKSGEYRWFRMQSVPKRLADGRTRITGVLADIHGQVSTQREIERHRARLEQLVAERTARLEAALAEAERRHREAAQADAAKSRFVAHMSHEMRTPLNGLLGLVELARHRAIDPTQQRFLDIAGQSGRMLMQVINDVLDLSRLEASALKLVEQPFDLAEAVAEAMRGVMPLVRDKGLSMRFDWTGTHSWVHGDEARIRQIVTNLVGNAAKFTERGYVALIVDLAEPAGGRCQLTLRVVDTGPGVDAERVDTLFGAFVQGDDTLSRRHGGTGLGLTISRSLARLMGGDITVDGTPGQGSVFTLSLSLRAADDPHPPPVPVPGLAWLVYRKGEIGEWLRRRLERIGWRADLVDGGEALLERAAAAELRPDLVVLAEHVLTPPPDLAAWRRALPQARFCLLVRPDWNDAAIEQRALELGMSLAVMPLTPRDLLRLTGTAPAAAAGAVAPPAEVDEARGHVLLVEDNVVNRLIGEEFLRRLGLAVRTAHDGEQALVACAEVPPRLVLMDLQMPGLDGVGATQALRERQHRGELPPFPIVALTAHAIGPEREVAIAAGMDGYLTKPLSMETLRSELARWLPELGAVPPS